MICPDCKQKMLKATSCKKKVIVIDGKKYKRDSSYFDNNTICHACGIENKKGNFHHPGCDMERCPKCKGQLISCGCNWDEDK